MTDLPEYTDEQLEAGRLMFNRPWTFQTSVADMRQLPASRGTEIAFAGRSNVGKSSLINALTQAHEKVGEVREGDHKGRHTTTWRQLVPLPGGGAVIDTPGVRSLGLWTDAETVEAAFTDIADLAEGCRFRDCAHDAEPGCAVRAAVAAGELAEARFDQYHAQRAEAAALERRTDPTAAKREGRRMGAMLREVREDQRRKGRDPGGAPQ